MGSRTLVTGASGYLGSTLVASLVRAGERVAIVQHPNDPATLPGELRPHVQTVYADITDARGVDEAMRDVSHVYHLAGIASPNSRLGHMIWQTNVLGTYHVARAALHHGVQRVVHVSSTAAIGYPPNGVVADEDFDPRDSVLDNVYSATKRAGERLMLDFVERGLDVVVVNPSAVFAPGSGPARSWQGLLVAARKGLLRVVPPGGTAVCSARDFSAGITAAMAKGDNGRRYILSTANLSYRQIGELLVAAVGRDHPVRSAPMGVFRTAGRGNRLLRDIAGRFDPDDVLAVENVELMAREVYYTPERAVRELGIPKVSTHELIAEFVR
ncbi:NAD-dependent epimerase/dehydratase family protein [Mycobacteroides immunogenum]|uniref:Nucleoside-diphosphate sugar epimerase n=1 Tax=Mycobacteroides immunogenum TaxID=83262 RepID=A0A7V8LRC3_9MYCO|nr:NAD-dependent epimerase/dehydratase family protein [Mycobacteroides immunogenum]AMT70449.1 nucleoside-diphosphate sugar epimerase [Mycobacteroides immunogenum]ANO03519.1 nucleoside-diphosphate sugar epimerase [Mycobacteroides immunogenum]KIU42018.1 nucleoside-diphosphate sugar epimerase [Mycobacteroides immunogenum]KPG13537.1 nucleoside-diphosphate sugar epimerase [Mycobacteroides immunogenum]KPG14542.1 nucleoside-diphosphate sugar epimerase [Mycobacteroides immunogenum]